MSTKTEYVPGKPTHAQEQLLAESVYRAYERGWKGSLREKTRPKLVSWASFPTLRSLRTKGHVEQPEDLSLLGGRLEPGENAAGP